MAAQERKNTIIKINFENLLNVAGKVKGVAKTIFSADSNDNWIIIDAEDLTPEKIKEFISGRRRG